MKDFWDEVNPESLNAEDLFPSGHEKPPVVEKLKHFQWITGVGEIKELLQNVKQFVEGDDSHLQTFTIEGLSK